MRPFRLIGTVLTAVLMCANFISCSKDNNEPITPEEAPTITIDPNIITNGLVFVTESDEKTISFTTNADWTLSVAATTGGSTWCTPSVTSGSKGSAAVKFTTTENTDYEDRSVAVTIKTGTTSKTFTITQKCKDAMLLTSDKFEVSQKGGAINIEVKANVNYQMEISETAKDWITQTSTRALTTHKHTFNIAANEEYNKREGEIYFINGKQKEIVKVYQTGGDRPKIITIDVPVAGELSNITERTDFKALKLTGRLNGKDVKTIRRMRHLEYLDISEVNIIGGERYSVENSYTIYGNDVLLEDNTIGLLMFNNDRDISSSVFDNLKEVLLPNSVTRIDRYAFDRVRSLCKVELPDKLETIGEFAFYECSNITNITIPNGVTIIEDGAFYNCI